MLIQRLTTLTHSVVILLMTNALLLESAATTPRPISRKDACDFWGNFTTQMNQINRQYSYLSYDCHYDKSSCNGAVCTGHIDYRAAGRRINTNFCFGMRVNHCDKDISMDIYYVNADKQSSNFNKRIHHNDEIEMKNLTMHVSKLASFTPFLFFTLTRPVPHHVLFGIRVKVRSNVLGVETFPEELQQDIIPNTEIPVTPCPAGQHPTIPSLILPTCKHTTPAPPNDTTTTSMAPVNINSSTYNKPCDNSVLDSCGVNEVCAPVQENPENTVCQCDNDLPPSTVTGYCGASKGVVTPKWPLGLLTTTASHVINQPQTGEQSKGVSRAAIIGGIIAGVVFLITILVIGLIIFRRYRNNQQYVGRLLLDNDDDTDNVI